MSDPIAERLSRLTPETALDRDALLFRAGQLSARSWGGWKLLVAGLALGQALTLALLWPRAPVPTPASPPPPASVPQGPAAPVPAPVEQDPYPAEEKLPPPLALEGLVPDAPPLRAFAAGLPET